jgi:hypothetical protein
MNLSRIALALALLWPGLAGAQGTPTFDSLVVTGAITAGSINAALSVTGIVLTYASAGAPAQFGEVNAAGTFNWPIAAAGGCCRLHYWSDTVTLTGNQAGTNVLEANFFNLITAGTGTLTNEAFNIVHPYGYIAPGVTISGFGEGFESSFLNDGTIQNIYGNLNIYTNGAGTTNTYVGFTTGVTNNNAAPGSFINRTGFECGVVGGSGSVPTFDWCMVNRDSAASIVSLGGIVIGVLGNATGPGTLFIQGANTSNTTFPLTVKNSAAQNVFFLTNAGGASLPLGTLTVPNGSVDASNFKVSGTIGANCTVGTLNVTTAIVQFGILTHC